MDNITKKSTATFSCIFQDDSGVVPALEITDIKITLYDKATKAIINSRDHQTVYGVNGGTWNVVTGAFSFQFSPDDNNIVDTTLADDAFEEHVLLVQWFYGGTLQGSEEFVFPVQNIYGV